VCAPALSGAQGSAEDRLKAAFVSKFPQFVEWPADAVNGRTTIDVCVAAPDPFGADMQELIAGETVSGRALAARHVETASEIATCHVLFLPSRPNGRHPLLAAAARRPILTVSDDPRFLADGGIVALRVVDGRVRFEIDDNAARRVGLRISSQLLRLGLSARGGGL
jgi:hypothetical protein